MAPPPAFIALSVAGSDPTGGAGVQGDLKTFAAHGVLGTAVVAAVTAQNARGVAAVHAVPAAVVAAQLEALLDQALPHATKTGMLFAAASAQAVGDAVRRHALRNLVVDPVLEASAGGALAEPGFLDAMRRHLFPLATLVTPNREEAAALLGKGVPAGAEEDAARALLAALGCRAVFLKGGHGGGPATDVLATGGGVHSFTLPRVDTPHSHGTGCALSAAIAARLAKGAPLPVAVEGAKAYVHRALAAATAFGSGPGAVRHDVPADG